MPPVWFRLTVAIVFLFAWCAPYYLDAASPAYNSGGGDGPLYLALYGGLTLVTGAIVGWPAPALPGIVYLALLPLGENPDDSDLHTYAEDYLYLAIVTGVVLLIGVLIGLAMVAIGRREAPAGTGDSREAEPRGARRNRRLMIVPVALAALIGVLLLVLVTRASGTQVEEPKLSIEGVTRAPPKPTDTQLRLLASDVDNCGSSMDRIVDLETSETASEVVIATSLEVDRQFPCGFTNGARVPFVVTLDSPLGRRSVIDDSRGGRTVIWTAAIGERLANLTTEDAERFLLSKRPGSDARCKRVRADFFSCDFIRAASGRRKLIGVTVLSTGKLVVR